MKAFWLLKINFMFSHLWKWWFCTYLGGWVVNFFHCLYNPIPKTKIWFNLHKLKIITNVIFSESLSFIPFVISPKYIFFYVCRNSKWATLAQYWVNTLLYMHNSMEVWFRVILKKFLGIKGSNLQQMFSSWLSFTWSCWIVFLFLGWGYTGSERNLPRTPPNYVQNCHYQRREKHELYFKQSECLYLPLTNITGHLEILKDFLKLSKWAKIRFYLRPPYTPTAAVGFWPTLSHFSTDLVKKGVILIRNTYCIKQDCPLRCLID